MPQGQKSRAKSTWPEKKALTTANPWKKAELMRAAEELRKAQAKEDTWIRQNLAD